MLERRPAYVFLKGFDVAALDLVDPDYLRISAGPARRKTGIGESFPGRPIPGEVIKPSAADSGGQWRRYPAGHLSIAFQSWFFECCGSAEGKFPYDRGHYEGYFS